MHNQKYAITKTCSIIVKIQRRHRWDIFSNPKGRSRVIAHSFCCRRSFIFCKIILINLTCHRNWSRHSWVNNKVIRRVSEERYFFNIVNTWDTPSGYKQLVITKLLLLFSFPHFFAVELLIIIEIFYNQDL